MKKNQLESTLSSSEASFFSTAKTFDPGSLHSNVKFFSKPIFLRLLEFFFSNLAIAFVYFYSGFFGLSLAFMHPSVTPVWPPTGIAISSILILGNRVISGIFMGAFAVNFMTSGSVLSSLGIALGNTLEAMIARYLLMKFAGGRDAFYHPHNVLKYILSVCLLSTAVSAFFGVLSLSLFDGLSGWHNYRAVGFTWWIGNAVSAILLVPVITTCTRFSQFRRFSASVWMEAISLVLTLGVTGQIVFGIWSPSSHPYPLSYFAILPLLWAAIRFGPPGAAAATLLTSIFAIADTVRGFGPFVISDANASMILLQMFMSLISLTTILVASYVAERNSNAQILHSQQERFSAIVNQAAVGIVQTDLAGKIVLANQKFCDIVGRPMNEILKMNIEELTHPEDRSSTKLSLEHMLAAGRPINIDKRYIKPNGRYVWVNKSVSIVTDFNGDPKYAVAVVLDVTDRRCNEEEMAFLYSEIVNQSQRMDRILSSVPGVVWEAWGEPEEFSQRIDYVSGYVETLLGYSVEEWLSTPNFWLKIVHPDDQERAAQEAAQIYASGKKGISEFRWIAKDGRVVWVEAQSVIIFDNQGTPIGMRGVTMDITTHKETEEALRISEKELSDFLYSASEGLHWSGPDGTIIRANQAELDLLGYSREEYIGHNIREFHADQKVIHDLLSRLMNKESLKNYEARLKCKDGSIRYVLINADVLWENGKFIHTRCFTRDITEKKVWEEELLRAHNQLENRVSQRTRELAEVNAALRTQIEERKKIEMEVLSISEREQRRIGQDLHDSLCQNLSGIAFMGKTLEHNLAAKCLPEAQDIAKILQYVHETILQARELARGLCPVEMDNWGLITSLEKLASNTRDMFNVHCTFQHDEAASVNDHAKATHLYHIAQEAINNAVKHARAKTIQIILKKIGNKIMLKVKDDGIGFESVPRSEGMGLRIMSYRANMIGAEFLIAQNPDKGSTALCTFSLEPKRKLLSAQILQQF